MANSPVRHLSFISTFLFLSVLSVSSVAIAQKPTPTPERDRTVVALLNDARLAAPEIGVDTLLKVVQSKKVKDPAWRREILDEAMRMADDVKYPIRKQSAFWGTGIVDTVSGYMQYAYEQKLDTLSLKARIIKDWLREDKARARQIVFQMGGTLNLKPIRCDEAMGYQVDDIYDSVGAVAKAAFTPKEIADNVRSFFLLPWVENIESPSQIPPVMEMLSGLQSPAAERQLLVNAFERAITRNFGDDRSFSYAFSREANKVRRFVDSADNPASLTATWRTFLAKNSTATRCLDSKPKKGVLPLPVLVFNGMFSEQKKFTLDDFASVEYKGIPNDKLYLDSETYKKVSLAFKTAREKKNLPENQGDKAALVEFQIRMSEVLELLDSWKASADEPEVEVFNMKTMFYRTMLDTVTEAEMKTSVLRAFMRYIAASPMQKESFIEWSFWVGWAAKDHPELFKELAEEFPNPNFTVMVAAKKVLAAEKEKSPVGGAPK